MKKHKTWQNFLFYPLPSSLYPFSYFISYPFSRFFYSIRCSGLISGGALINLLLRRLVCDSLKGKMKMRQNNNMKKIIQKRNEGKRGHGSMRRKIRCKPLKLHVTLISELNIHVFLFVSSSLK